MNTDWCGTREAGLGAEASGYDLAGSQVPGGPSSPLGGTGANTVATSLIRKERLLSPRGPAIVKRYFQGPDTSLRPVRVRSGEGLAPLLCLPVPLSPPSVLFRKHIAPLLVLIMQF